MSINIKKHTKEQMARMVEEAQEKTAALEAEIAELKRKLAVQGNMIDQMNGEAITRANEISNLKANVDELLAELKSSNDTTEAVTKELQRANSDCNDLRNKLADTEAALGRANAQAAQWIGDYDKVCIKAYNHYHRANYAEAHPFRNLWAWIKRKLGCKA